MAENASTYYSNGKLLLSGEYVVLDGALSLALPLTYGQYLRVNPIESPEIVWKSLDEKNSVWFEAVLNNDMLKAHSAHNDATPTVQTSSNDKTARTLLKIIIEAKRLNPAFLTDSNGYRISTRLTFPRNWGMGSSSTLINNIAQWAGIDAYELLQSTFPGSGYDIACAQHHQPIIYRRNGKTPVVKPSTFYHPFADRLYFVYLNKKQDSREGIRRYQNVKENKAGVIKAISDITEEIRLTTKLNDFERLIEMHEEHIAGLLQLPKIKEKQFPDYSGSIKSLGAWGGDFILATGNNTTPAYFKARGFSTVLAYEEIVLGK